MAISKANKRGIIIVAVFFASVIIISIVAISSLFIYSFAPPSTFRFTCFETLDDLSPFEEYVTADLALSRDRNLKSEPKDYWCKEIKYDGHKYDVRAYVFASDDEAAEYFKEETGKVRTDDHNYFFSYSWSIFFPRSSYIILKENRIFYMEGNVNRKTFAAAYEELGKDFTEIKTP